MAFYKVTDLEMKGVADTIRSMAGQSKPLVWPSGFKSAIQSISGGVLGSKTITSNGVYNASYDQLDGFSQVTVSVSGGDPVLSSATFTENGSYSVPTGYDGFGDVVVSVPGGASGSISISQNGTYDVSSFAEAVVSVQGGGGGDYDNFLIACGAMSGSIL